MSRIKDGWVTYERSCGIGASLNEVHSALTSVREIATLMKRYKFKRVSQWWEVDDEANELTFNVMGLGNKESLFED